MAHNLLLKFHQNYESLTGNSLTEADHLLKKIVKFTLNKLKIVDDCIAFNFIIKVFYKGRCQKSTASL